MTVYLSLKIVSHSCEMNPRWEFLYIIGHCPFIACSVCDKRIIMFLCLDIAQQTDIIWSCGIPNWFSKQDVYKLEMTNICLLSSFTGNNLFYCVIMEKKRCFIYIYSLENNVLSYDICFLWNRISFLVITGLGT